MKNSANYFVVAVDKALTTLEETKVKKWKLNRINTQVGMKFYGL